MDPIGFDGGNNLYRFVNNNPVTGTDPSGRLIAYLAYADAPGGGPPGDDTGGGSYSVVDANSLAANTSTGPDGYGDYSGGDDSGG